MITSPAEEIKARLDIVEFIQSYVRLEKAGINLKACCPFHSEKTPSFFVSPTRQTWHCFGGCGEGGDIFSFVMKMEGVEFPEALRTLASRAGVTVAHENPALRSEKGKLYEVCEAAAKILERQLLMTPEPKEYLKARGITESTVRAFRIGFAPESWDFLLRSLAAKKITADMAEKAGLAIRSQDGRSRYDRFRSRIMFPVMDAAGRVVGFGGRIFGSGAKNQESEKIEKSHFASSDGSDFAKAMSDKKATDGQAKYVNTPQTLIYDKSRLLYGFDKAKQEIRVQNRVVVVEGYMDCVMSHQAGVRHTVAVSGTAFTQHQLRMLRRLCDTMVSSFDADAAGESATRRSLALAAEFDFTRLVASIPSGKDPADTVRENPHAWQEAVAQAKPVVAFYFEKAFREYDPATPEGKKKITGLIFPFLSELSDEVEKAHWVKELSQRIGVLEHEIREDLKRSALVPRAAVETPPGKERPATLSRREALEERFTALLGVAPEETRTQAYADHEIMFVSQLRRELCEAWGDPSLAPREVRTEIAVYGDAMRLKGEMLRDRIPSIMDELLLCRKELEKLSLRERLERLGSEIQEHEREKDETALTSLLENFRTLSGRLRSLA